MTPTRLLTLGTHRELAASLARELGHGLTEASITRAPDGEAIVSVPPELVGQHTIIVHPTFPSAGERLLELLLAADACRRVGTRAISAVIPYMGYARQEHRKRVHEALGMRVVGEMLGLARLERVTAIDLHSPAIEGFLPCPVEHLTALGALIGLAKKHVTRDSIVVAPDLGAAKMAQDVAHALELPVAILHKSRRSSAEVSIDKVIGDVRGRRPIIVDDMITSGATIGEAARALFTEGSAPEVVVVATHALLVGGAVQKLSDARVTRLIVSDTLPEPHDLPFACEIAHVAPILATALRRSLQAL